MKILIGALLLVGSLSVFAGNVTRAETIIISTLKAGAGNDTLTPSRARNIASVDAVRTIKKQSHLRVIKQFNKKVDKNKARLKLSYEF